jgi:DNA polymerase elongation subunit (family B)
MVYSGTDDLKEARKMADVLKREVNKHYKCMEIDIDGVMGSMLLLKKKKYAALLVEEKNGELVTTRETKGLDLVRRDWCTLSRTVGSDVLDFILSGMEREELVSKILEYLRDVAAKVPPNALASHPLPYRAIPCHLIPYHVMPYHTIPYHANASHPHVARGRSPTTSWASSSTSSPRGSPRRPTTTPTPRASHTSRSPRP